MLVVVKSLQTVLCFSCEDIAIDQCHHYFLIYGLLSKTHISSGIEFDIYLLSFLLIFFFCFIEYMYLAYLPVILQNIENADCGKNISLNFCI
jgi:hypothetical protein